MDEERQELRMISSFLAVAAGWGLVPFKRTGKSKVGAGIIKKSMSSDFRFCSNNHN